MIAGFFSVSKTRHFFETKIYVCNAIASAVWSIFYGLMMLQTDQWVAWFFRMWTIGGVVGYMITAQMFVCALSDLSSGMKKLLNATAFLGIPVFFFLARPGVMKFYLEDWGMTFQFQQSVISDLYISYLILVAVNILYVICRMLKSDIGSRRNYAKYLLVVEGTILLGMVLDMIFPLRGKPAFPGSTITQFWGLLVLGLSLRSVNRSRVNVSNMSEFIYYSLEMPVMVYDQNRKLKIVNEAAAEFLHIVQDEKGDYDLPIERIFEVDSKNLFEVEGRSCSVDTICLKNQIFCNLSVSKIFDKYHDIIGYIIIVADLSEQKKAMKELELAKISADRANQAKSAFLANMSHEIRTPMNAIIGFSELALKVSSTPELSEYISDIRNSSYSLLAIINEILDISKIESGKMELTCNEYYPASIFRDVYLIIQTQAEQKGLSFMMEIDPSIPNKLYGDKTRIREIMINILNNAVKYTQEGYVKFAVRVQKISGEIVVLEIKVEDSGIGIKEEDKEKIFENFSRTDMEHNQSIEGTGLGLAITKAFIQLMEGSLSLESEYTKGSVFLVELPQKIVDLNPIEMKQLTSGDSSDEFSMGDTKFHNLRVLVVDDNNINLKVIEKSLVHYGMQVDLASSGMEAIRKAQEFYYPVIFMDQMMPQMDGIEAMKQIRKLNSFYAPDGEAKIIVLTANAIYGAREELLKEGFDEYLGKPINYSQMERTLRRLLPEFCDTDETQGKGEEQRLHDLKIDSDMFPTLSVSDGISYCGGDLVGYLEILSAVYEASAQQIRDLSAYREEYDISNYTILIHALKGVCLNIGANLLAEKARRLEMAGKEENLSYIEKETDAFIEKYLMLMQEIYDGLKEIDPELIGKDSPETDLFGIDSFEKEKTVFAEFLEKLKKSAENYDFASLSKLLCESEKEEWTQTESYFLQNVKKLYEDYDLDSIIQQVENYKNSAIVLQK